MGREMRYSAPRGAPAETAIDFLARRFTYFTADDWRRQIERGYVRVNGATLEVPEQVLRQQDRLFYEPPRELEPDVDRAFTVHANDDAVVVVSKSGNIPVGEGGRYSRNVLTRVVPEVLGLRAEGHGAGGDDKEECKDDTASAKRACAENAAVPAGGKEEDVGRGGLPPQLHAVHRLDKETSGLVVMAKTRDAAAFLGEQFALHAAQASGSVKSTGVVAPMGAVAAPPEPAAKTYDVLLVGDLAAVADAPGLQWQARSGDQAHGRELVVEASIGNAAAANADSAAALKATAEDPLAKLRMACFVDGVDDAAAVMRAKAKAAKSIFTVVQRYTLPGAVDVTLTLAKVQLFTGRTHQIRLHAAWCGCPVAGDKLYVSGGGTVPVSTYIARARGEATVTLKDQTATDAAPTEGGATSTFVVSRHLLHSASLAFTHPLTKERVSFAHSGLPCFAAENPWLAELQPL